MRVSERQRLQREIFRLVMVHGPMTRGALMEELGVSRASVTRFSAPLLRDGLIREGAQEEFGQRGRPNRPLELNADSRLFQGFKLTGDAISAVVTDLSARPVRHARETIEDPSPQAVVSQLANLSRSLTNEIEPAAVGVSLGGLVSDDGVVEHEDFLHWQDFPLAQELQKKIGRPVTVENDVVALTVAEQWFGWGRGVEHFALFTIGAGIGYGLVVNDEVLDTRRAREGLIGHLPLSGEGPVCALGHPGCATAMLTTPALLERMSAAAGRWLSWEEALDSGDERVQRELNRSGAALGRVLAEIGMLAMVDKVILSGEGAALYEATKTEVTAALHRFSPARLSAPEVIPDHRGFDLWARGAAAAAIQRSVLGL